MDRIKQLALTGAHWWTCQLRSPDSSNFTSEEHGEIALIAMELGRTLAEEKLQNNEQIQIINNFEEVLRAKIENMLKKSNCTCITLRVNYAPIGVLAEVTDEVGLSSDYTSGLPWQTTMNISLVDGVRVKKGYLETWKNIMK